MTTNRIMNKRKAVISASLSLADIVFLEELVDGNLSAAIALCVALCREQKSASLAAIKAAAERRDQDAIRRTEE